MPLFKKNPLKNHIELVEANELHCRGNQAQIADPQMQPVNQRQPVNYGTFGETIIISNPQHKEGTGKKEKQNKQEEVIRTLIKNSNKEFTKKTKELIEEINSTLKDSIIKNIVSALQKNTSFSTGTELLESSIYSNYIDNFYSQFILEHLKHFVENPLLFKENDLILEISDYYKQLSGILTQRHEQPPATEQHSNETCSKIKKPDIENENDAEKNDAEKNDAANILTKYLIQITIIEANATITDKEKKIDYREVIKAIENDVLSSCEKDIKQLNYLFLKLNCLFLDETSVVDETSVAANAPLSVIYANKCCKEIATYFNLADKFNQTDEAIAKQLSSKKTELKNSYASGKLTDCFYDKDKKKDLKDELYGLCETIKLDSFILANIENQINCEQSMSSAQIEKRILDIMTCAQCQHRIKPGSLLTDQNTTRHDLRKEATTAL